MIGSFFVLALALAADAAPPLPVDGIELWQGVRTGMTSAQVLATIKQCEPTQMALRFPDTPVMFPLTCATSIGGDQGHAQPLMLQGGVKAVTYSSDTIFIDHEKSKFVETKIKNELNEKYNIIENCHDVVVEKIPTSICRWTKAKMGVFFSVQHWLNGTDHLNIIYAPLPSS